MSFVRTALISAAVLGVVTSGAGLAQTATPEASTPLVGAGAYHYAQAATPEASTPLVGAGAYHYAQAATPESSAPSKEASTSSKLDDVSKWTRKEWNKARAQWAKEKDKWADCQKQSKDQKLTGRKSWSFLASCMTS
jgi:hypothetical protein